MTLWSLDRVVDLAGGVAAGFFGARYRRCSRYGNHDVVRRCEHRPGRQYGLAVHGLRFNHAAVYHRLLQLCAPALAFIDGILKPFAIGAAGLMLLLLTNIMGLKDQHVSHIGWGTLIFAALWVVLLVGVRKEYVEPSCLPWRAAAWVLPR